MEVPLHSSEAKDDRASGGFAQSSGLSYKEEIFFCDCTRAMRDERDLLPKSTGIDDDGDGIRQTTLPV